VLVVEVVVVVVGDVVVVVGSLQPNHPGVLQVSVLVEEVDVDDVVVVVLGFVCVPFSNFHK